MFVLFKGLAWIPTKFTNRSKDWPDIEFHFVSGSPGSDGGRQIRKVTKFTIWQLLFMYLGGKLIRKVKNFVSDTLDLDKIYIRKVDNFISGNPYLCT